MLNILMQRCLKYSLQMANHLVGRFLPKNHVYFAYGANMDHQLLEQKSVFVDEGRAAVLHQHKIEISSPCEWRSKGFASISPVTRSLVYGVLYDVSILELMILDVLEWVPFQFHERRLFTVKTVIDQKHIDAWAYVAKYPRLKLKTSIGYKNILLNCAVKAGFPENYIQTLNDFPVSETFELDHGFRLSNPGKRRWFESRFSSFYKIHDQMREALCKKLP